MKNANLSLSHGYGKNKTSDINRKYVLFWHFRPPPPLNQKKKPKNLIKLHHYKRIIDLILKKVLLQKNKYKTSIMGLLQAKFSRD